METEKKDHYFRGNILKADDKAYGNQQLSERMQEVETQQIFREGKYWYFSHPIEDTGYYVVIQVYSEDVLNTYIKKRTFILAILFAVVLIMSLAYVGFSGKMSDSVRKLQKLFVVELVEGDFAQKQNEVQEAIRYMGSYRQLCQWMKRYYEDLLGEIFKNSRNKTASEMIRVKQYIAENYDKDLSLKELSEVACVSQNYFSSLFKKETGENYKSYVTRIRMEEAIKLVLKTDLKTYEISEKVGYNNVRRFVDAFKNSYKMSPMDYRKIYRKK